MIPHANGSADDTTGADLRSWVEGADGSGFCIQHLPYGVFTKADRSPRVGVAIGDAILDLAAVAAAGGFADAVPDAQALFATDRLNPFMAAGPSVWQATRARVSRLLRAGAPDAHRAAAEALIPRSETTMRMPFEVADYVDFFSSLDHASNAGRLLRPGAATLSPNWRHLPVGYHGRAGTVVPSGTPVIRPHGQRRPPGAEAPVCGPSRRLDVELEVGFVIGPPSTLGGPVPIEHVGEHIFGIALVNDWSARDIQGWESQPLGPFLGKSFATSVSVWVTPLAALEPFRVPGPVQEPPVLDYLRTDHPWGLDLCLEIGLRSPGMVAGGAPHDVISRTGFAGMYWTMAQQLAHATVNGASVRTGDLFASGTVSGPVRGSEGCLLELTRAGREPLPLSDGSTRAFLEDGDEVVLRGSCGGNGRPHLELGEVHGKVMAR
ncbi:MAG: fumarylacetoacetase [Nitriliruptorales bacterium]|nr:fumarylacetoacetase [Nitriliruptorales bacterium]